jgi:REP element-mobilizing transposase RayT
MLFCMARALRTDFPGAVHHVTSRGNERRPIFFDDHDRETFLRFVGDAARRFSWSVTAYVLMTNHFHLLVQTREANLSRGMHWLNTRYAVWVNRRHERSGHLYGGRFKAFLIEKETYFREVLRYVALNPVRAKLVERPEDFVWSSYRATCGLTNAPGWLDVTAALAQFAGDGDAAQRLYREFVEQKIGSTERLWDHLKCTLFLGTEEWLRRVRRRIESKPRSSEHPKRQRGAGRPEMRHVIAAVASTSGTSEDRIRHGRGGRLRRLAAWIGWDEGWLTLASIAAALRIRSEGHISGLIRRVEREFAVDGELLELLDASLVLLRP